MRSGQKMTLEEIRKTASNLVEERGTKQSWVAEQLDISPGSISTALNNAGTHLVGIQAKIIGLLSDYTIEREVRYIVRRKTNDEDNTSDGGNARKSEH